MQEYLLFRICGLPNFAWHSCCAGKPDNYSEMLREVVRRTASLVAQWQAVGFVHGVCNTDNFSIIGETIDYGCAFPLDCYLFIPPPFCSIPALTAYIQTAGFLL